MSSPPGIRQPDSFFSKFDTFRRRKRTKQEIEELTKEGRQAIESSVSTFLIDDPRTYLLEEGESRSLIEKSSLRSPKVQELTESLLTWINEHLMDQRILVRDLQEDLYDGQILQKLVEKLASIRLEHPEVTQTEFGQVQRLKEVLEKVNALLGLPSQWAEQRWNPELIHSKDLISSFRLLVALARHFKAPFRIRDGIFVNVIIVRKINGKLECRQKKEYLTEPCGGDVVDNSLNQHPFDKLPVNHIVPRGLIAFANAHLAKLSLRISDPAKDLADGVFLILLLGLLEGYFVPLYAFNISPPNQAACLANLKFAFELMHQADLSDPSLQPDDIISAGLHGDSRPALRVLYTIYSHYRYYDGGTGSGLSDDPLDPTFSEAEMATSPPEILPNSSASEAQQSPTLGDHQHLRTGGITESIYSN